MLPRKKLTLKEMQDIVNEWSEDDDEEGSDVPSADGDNVREEPAGISALESEAESDGEIVIECADGSDVSDFSESYDDERSSDGGETDDSSIPHIHCSPSGILWSEEPFPVRLMNRNIVRFSQGPTFTPATEKDSFFLFFDEEMISQLHLHTNKRMKALHKTPFSFDEIHAALGIIIRAGSDRDNLSSLKSLFDPKDSRPFFRCAMSYNRFKLFLRYASIDNRSTRRQRQVDDKMAAVRDLWNLFQRNLLKYYVPSENLTIDEQLYGYRGYVPGRSYMASKPAKYGMKIFWICDSSNGFALKGLIYAGKTGEHRQTGLTQSLVEELSIPFHHTNRNIYMDRYFTSFSVVSFLLEHGLTAVGTITASRRDVPAVLKTVKGRERFSSKTLYEHQNKVLLLSYVPKKNKGVLMMSSFHQKPNIQTETEDKKSQLIIDYNFGKGGVDIMDSRIEDFTCKRKTNRYTMLMLFNIIDISVNNSFLLFAHNSPKMEKKTFMKALSEQLAHENIISRFHNPKVFAQTKESFRHFGLSHQTAVFSPQSTMGSKPTKCQERGCRKSTRINCHVCLKCVCCDHKITRHSCLQCNHR